MEVHTIYVDIETAGLLPTHPTIQLAAIAVNDRTGEECAAFQRKIQFDEAKADPQALAMNHYDADVWRREAVPSDDAVRDLSAFARPYRCIQMVSKATGNPYSVAKLAGHNALTFDLPRLRALYDGAFFPFSYHVKDTLQRAMWFFDEHPEIARPESLKLSVLCAFFGIAVDGAHDALTDVRLAAKLAFAIREREIQR